MSGFLLRISRIAGYLALTFSAMPVQAALLLVKSPAAARLPLAYHRLCCRILGIALEISGAPSRNRPTLFAVNHTSYLDITILGACIEGSFVSKAEVAQWPIFGWLAKLQRSVFVERADRAGASRQRDAIRRRLDDGDMVIPSGLVEATLP